MVEALYIPRAFDGAESKPERIAPKAQVSDEAAEDSRPERLWIGQETGNLCICGELSFDKPRIRQQRPSGTNLYAGSSVNLK